MKNQLTTNKLVVELTHNQFWYLTRYFGPGIVFGLKDPTEKMSEDDINKVEQETIRTLHESGYMSMDSSNNIQIDEMLGAMVYSCLHSDDILFLKIPNTKEERFIFFLPEWQLELHKLPNHYELTLFKELSDIYLNIIKLTNVELQSGNEEMRFTIGRKELEIADALYSSGETNKAIELMKDSVYGKEIDADKFLLEYRYPKFHLMFNLIKNVRDNDRIYRSDYELLQTQNNLFWLSHGVDGESGNPIIYIISISAEDVKKRIYRILT